MKLYSLPDGRFEIVPEYFDSIFKERNSKAKILGSYYEPRYRLIRKPRSKEAIITYLDESIHKTMKTLKQLTSIRSELEGKSPRPQGSQT